MHNDNWGVAVTTAPREEHTIHRCIASIHKAGWEPVVFAKPGSQIADAEMTLADQVPALEKRCELQV